MPKEIVIFTRSLPLHQLGGMEIIAWDFAKEFVRQGSAVRLITTSLTSPERGEFDLDGVRVVPLARCPSARYTSSWWRESRTYFEAHCLKSTHAVLSVSAAGFGVLALKPRLKSVPFVMQAHGTSWAEIVSKWRSRRIRNLVSSLNNFIWMPRDMWAYRRFDAVVAVGEKVQNSLRSAPTKWLVRPHSVSVIANGVDVGLFRPDPKSRREVRARLGIDERAPVVVSANRLHVQKGTHHCLEAIAKFGRIAPEFRYLVAGDGPEFDSLRSIIRHYGLERSVLLMGRVERTDLAWWLRGADALLFLTEREEGLPLNVLEALATGVPIVASKCLTVLESPDIHRVDPRKPGEVCDALNKVISEGRNAEKCSRLPPAFELQYAARQYLSMFDREATRRRM